MQIAVRTRGLCKRYHGKAAVDHLDMQVPQGEIYGFIGANGAGKSTTFKLLAGLANPTAGQIEIFGQPLHQGGCGRRVGILIEDAGLYGSLSAADNCLLQAKLLGLDDEKTAVGRVLAQTGLEHMGRKAAKHFSMGQRRRLGLALALLGSPDLLLLDEPTNGLDPEGIRDVRLLLQQLQAEHGVTIVVSSHILGELEKFATCYGIIRDGRMVQEITAAELSSRCRAYIALQTPDPHRAAALLEDKLHLHDYTVRPEGELRIYDPADPARINAVLLDDGVAVQSIGTHSQELEDYFLQMMGVENHV